VIGEVVDGYRIKSKLGEGGMGIVFYAEHESIGTKAAVKVLLPELSANREIVARFFNEARATTLIEHPGIVKVFHFGHGVFQLDEKRGGQCAYMIMEFLRGQSLGSKIRRDGYLAFETIHAITVQAAKALGAAHEKGIVHRDLKPDNVFIVPDERIAGGDEVKILDFGIAKLASDAAGGVQTRSRLLMGTPGYMSPEQCRGASAVDHRSDMYSLGCIVYEMAVGQRPFANITAQGELITMHQHHDPAAPRSLVPGLSPGLEAVILCMLAKKPEHRYQTMRDLVEDLDRLARGEAPQLSSKTPTRKPTIPARPPLEGTAPIAGSAAPSAPTTLGSAASQAIAATAPKRRVLLAAGIVTTVAIGVAVFGLTRGTKNQSDQPVTSVPREVAPAGEPPSVDAGRAEPVAAAEPPAETETPAAAVDAGAVIPEPPATAGKRERSHKRRTSTPNTTGATVAPTTTAPTSTTSGTSEPIDRDKIKLPQ
jgi:serine/threonine-protein kinase